MKGIIMSGESVPGILAGTKTQSRRTGGLEAVNEEPGRWWLAGWEYGVATFLNTHHETVLRCKPRYQPGEVVYMKETWQVAEYRIEQVRPIERQRQDDDRQQDGAYDEHVVSLLAAIVQRALRSGNCMMGGEPAPLRSRLFCCPAPGAKSVIDKSVDGWYDRRHRHTHNHRHMI